MNRFISGRHIFSNRLQAIGIGILIIFGLMALGAPYLLPYDPKEPGIPFLSPSLQHFFGTNDMGYDIFAEWVCAARVSLTIGVLAGFISVFVGCGAGILAGYAKGITGEAMSGVIDVFLLIPMLPLMVVAAAYLGPGVLNSILVIGLLCWCGTARAVRAKVMQLRKSPFVEALRILGFSRYKIIISHIIPHMSDIVSAKFATSVAAAMTSEAALSFIGFGDPSLLSWGGMIHFAMNRGGFSNNMWAWYLPPGLSIGICSLGFMLAGTPHSAVQERRISEGWST